MSIRIQAAVSALILLSAALAYGGQKDRYADLTEEEAAKVWIEEIVPYIATKQEKEIYGQLETSEERVQFIETFWAKRDPTPGTPENEYQQEHYRRLAYANQFFTAGRPGWRTDRGRIYILLGPPDSVDSDPMGRWAHQYPTEVWTYNKPPHRMLGPNMEIAFVDRRLTGDYEITFNLLADSDASRRAEALMHDDFLDEWARAEIRSMNFGRPGTTSFGDGLAPELERMRELALATEVPENAIRPLEETVSTDFSFDTAVLPVEPVPEFYRATDGEVCIPVNLNVPYEVFAYAEREELYESRFEILGRLVDEDGETVDEFVRDELFGIPKEQLASLAGQTMLYQLVLYAPPGKYRLQVALRDQDQQRLRLTERELVVPEIGDSLELSTVVLADQIMELPQALPEGKKEPFTFGKYKVLPNTTGAFASGGQLDVHFEVYNLALDEEGKSRVKIEYTFRREGRLFRAVPAIYPFPDTRQDRTIMSSIPLEDFTPASYSVTVKVTDEVSGETASRDVPFVVR